MNLRVKFAWYDLWVGAYIDRAKRTLYVCPLPMLLVEVHVGHRSPNATPG